MKTYSEKAINPKTKKKEEIEVYEYSFEDWIAGKISGNWVSGKKLVFNTTEQKYHFDYLPHKEYEKIEVERKDIYWKKVANLFNVHKTSYNITHEKSGNKERLIQTEIKKAENFLFKSELYDQLIVKGNREYYFTNSPNCQVSFGVGDYNHIKIEALSQFYEWLKNIANPTSTPNGIKYYDDDPEKGGKQINYYDYLKISGMLDSLNEKGMVINPTHDFELLKTKRKELFDKAKKGFVSDRELNKLETSSFDLNCFYVMWLNNELKVIAEWLSNKYPNGETKKLRHSNSDQIEIMKYNHYVKSEITQTEAEINNSPPLNKQSPPNEVMPENYLSIAKILIQKKKQAEQAVKALEKELSNREKEKERQRDRAEKGQMNELAFQQLKIAKTQLALIQANEILSEIEQEIETHKLAADLNRANESKNKHADQINESGKKYYSDNDFATVIEDLLKKEMFEVNDFLEYHFSQAFVANNMSKFNWLTSLRKNLMNRFTAPTNITENSYIADPKSKTPSQINLAYKWERSKNVQLVKEVDERTNNKTSKNTPTANKTKLSISQIALIHCYEGKRVTRINGNKIAKEYGHNSGEKLFQKFTFFSSSQNRKGKPTPATPKKFENKISLLESVIEMLSDKAQQRATDELKTLKTLFKDSDL